MISDNKKIENYIKVQLEILEELLKRHASDLDIKTNFFDLGLSSISALDFIELVNKRLKINLSPEVIYEVDSIKSLALHINELYNMDKSQDTDKIEPYEDISIQTDQDIAIIGLSGRFPDLDNIDMFWDLLYKGDTIIRKDNKKILSEELGIYLKNKIFFDADFFGIGTEEAYNMDPQQRIFLEEAYKAFEDSGYSPELLSEEKVGIFIGNHNSGYEKLLHSTGKDSTSFLGNELAVLPSRFSYIYNLKGPAFSLDSACSSAFLTIKMACDSLNNYESNLALAGGIFINASLDFFTSAKKSSFLSKSGECNSFSENADGMILSEGIGLVVLKRLEDAKKDNDHIYGIIKKVEVEQAGKTNGLGAPNLKSEIALLEKTYNKGNVSIDDIDYMELHGTGTPIGDAIEIKSVKQFFFENSKANHTCILGTHKPNIGHTVYASGMASLFKVIMAFQHKVIPATISINGSKKILDGGRGKLIMANEPIKIEKSNNSILAGINSFGLNGTNCHMIIESPKAHINQNSPDDEKYYLLVFSAKNKYSLKEKLITILEWLNKNDNLSSISQLAFTLSKKRVHHKHRFAVISKSLADISYSIKENLNADTFDNNLSYADGNSDLIEIAKEYISGADIDWDKIYVKTKFAPIHIPGYSFNRKKYWTQVIDNNYQNIEKPILKKVGQNRGLQMNALHSVIYEVLFYQLTNMGIFEDLTFTLDEICDKHNIFGFYKKWITESFNLLKDAGYLEYNHNRWIPKSDCVINFDNIWERWEEEKTKYLYDSNIQSQIKFLDIALKEFPYIITRNKSATDIFFPEASFDNVVNIYSNNQIADFFNEIVANIVEQFLKNRLSNHIMSPINILEIGAGTGGTTGVVLKKLESYFEYIKSYYYTDISKAFLTYGASKFSERFPKVQFEILDIESIDSINKMGNQNFDVVIATNVLHATRRITNTLNNINNLLLPKGILCINEINSKSLFTHMTFGLLEGWWLAEDLELRIPGCPALNEATWKSVLEKTSYSNICYPAIENAELGQQIIVAEKAVNTHMNDICYEQDNLSTFPPIVSSMPECLSNKNQIEKVIIYFMAEELAIDAKNVNVDLPFREQGIDSLLSGKLINRINTIFNININTTLLFEYNTIRDLANYLSKKYQKIIEPITTKANKSINSNKDIAIIGYSGRFGQCHNMEALWNQLEFRSNDITKSTRWENSKYKAYLLDKIDEFDPMFFNISGIEADYMDPQQRIFLEEAWKAMEDAGYCGESVAGSKCGVYVACGNSDYTELFDESTPSQAFWGNMPSVIAARIAYYLDLHGPAIAIDTACSSSLVALHCACQSLWAGELDMAVAGGISIQCTPKLIMAEERVGMLSPSGMCRAFDNDADGFTYGEGVGVVVLKRLEDALKDNDTIHGVIRGIGVNQDGATNGLTAPSVKAQENLEKSVYEQFSINPEEIQMVEAHGTGTKLGDPIEFHALTRAFRSYTAKKKYCAIGSVKTNIGHTQYAAGMAGLLKILLSLKHGKIPASLHFYNGNRNIDFEDTPFYVNTQLKEWTTEEGKPRQAALSSFGASGTNAHVVISEGMKKSVQHSKHPAYLFVLSARTKEQLNKEAEQMIDFISKDKQLDSGNVSYTLLFGRKHMKFRLSCIAKDMEDLKWKLKSWKNGTILPGVYEGTGNPAQDCAYEFEEDYIEKCIKCVQDETYEEILGEVGKLYAEGRVLEYEKLYSDGQYGRIPLPTYPFAREHHWIGKRALAQGKEPVFFEEVLKEEAAEPGTECEGSIICFLSDKRKQQEMEEEIKRGTTYSDVIYVSKQGAFQKIGENEYGIFEQEAAQYIELFRTLKKEHRKITAVVYLWMLDDKGSVENPLPLLYLFQGIIKSGIYVGQVIIGGEYADDISNSYLDSYIGFGRSLRGIMPKTPVYTVYQKPGSMEGELDLGLWTRHLMQEIYGLKKHDVVYKDEQRFRMSVKKVESNNGVNLLRQKGTYLLTGGTGAISSILGEMLGKKYQANLILMGRRHYDRVIEQKIKDLEKNGAKAIYTQGNAGSEEDIRRAIEKGKESFGKINGIFHGAGVQEEGTILERTGDDFIRVIEPKIKGLLAIERALETESIDFVCYMSSISAVLGDFGSCDYSIANRFLTAFSKNTKKPNRFVIGWPLWEEGGMGFKEKEAEKMYLKISGQEKLKTEEGIEIWQKILCEGSQKTYFVVKGDIQRIDNVLDPKGSDAKQNIQVKTIKDNLDTSIYNNDTFKVKSTHNLITENYQLPDSITVAEEKIMLKEKILKDITREAGKVLGFPPDKLDIEANLSELGFDSISLADYAERLTKYYGIVLTPALFFKYTTIEKVVEYYIEEQAEKLRQFYKETTNLQNMDATEEIKTENKNFENEILSSESRTIFEEEIAIIGMSGRFPGADNVEELWSHLASGNSMITQMPKERLGGNEKSRREWYGGWINGVDEFDPQFFGITPKEAEMMDPRHRLLLQESYHALEDAGYGEEQIKHEQIGMFVGAERSDLQKDLSEYPITSNHEAIMSARVSYFLDLHGPNMTINTACSSGLAAVHEACQSIRSGECDSALAAGVNLILSEETLKSIEKAGMFSEDGTCYAFDRRANGMVPSEAVAVVMLKSLRKAEHDGDPIYAVIKGSGMNYDGKTNGITAPGGTAQTELICKVYDRYKIDPGKISYVVAHGTGTRLGDPVEVNALREAYNKYTTQKGYCAITSVKTNLGHSFAASGVVSLISLIESIKHKKIPASLNYKEKNEYVIWENSPFYVNDTLRQWEVEEGSKRTGAVSAFGMSGTNVHMVVEEYVNTEKEINNKNNKEYLLVLSAKTEKALDKKIHELEIYLEDKGKEESIESISKTLLEGRFHYEYRCAIIAKDHTDACMLLKKLENGEQGRRYVRGQINLQLQKQAETVDIIEKLIRISEPSIKKDPNMLNAFASMYCLGIHLVPEDTGIINKRKIHLPTYPFDKYVAKEIKLQSKDKIFLHQNTISEKDTVNKDYSNSSIEDLKYELINSLADALYIESSAINEKSKFIDIGLDSIIGVEWVNKINAMYNVHISATKIYDYPDVESLAVYLEEQIVNDKITKKNHFAFSQNDVTHISSGSLGNNLFCERYGCKYNYYAGSMANGVSSIELVRAMSENSLLSFFGSGGLKKDELEAKIVELQKYLPSKTNYGMCFVSSIEDQKQELEQAELFIKYNVPIIEVAAFSTITLPLVYLRLKGLRKNLGKIIYPRRLIGKCSRVEVARKFMLPPPENIVNELFHNHWITQEEAEIAKEISLVDDIAVEADSAGHTDMGSLLSLAPTIIQLRNNIVKDQGYQEYILVGGGGGLGTPESIASAFMLGLDFVFTGSINQCTIESGAHDFVKDLLSTLDVHDTGYTIAGDMFEIGSKVQVVKKNTKFLQRSNTLYKIFSQYDCINSIPDNIIQEIEKDYFKKSFADVWKEIINYKKEQNHQRDLEEAEKNPKYKMSLIMKWYCSHCNQITLQGKVEELDNFEIFCGPALGSFNNYVKGTRLQNWRNRHVYSIAEFLMQQAEQCIENKNVKESNVSPANSHRDIAIIGISGQFPNAKDVNEFWENIVNGNECLSPIELKNYWEHSEYFDVNPEIPGKYTIKNIGRLENIDMFDADFFNISPVEAKTMDPQQRIFLQNCWTCIENAGIKPALLKGSRCAVYVGCASSGYENLPTMKDLETKKLSGNANSILASRISYLLDLKGPALSIDTACSSSLVAISEACDSLILNNCDYALAGGVNLILDPSLLVKISKAGMLSTSNHCHVFDENADGFVPGEGVGVLLLKRLDDAVNDGDIIYGTIKGWGVNQDGKTNGIMAPSSKAQADLESSIYNRFNINPENITYIEAHGTGTKLGDPIEVEALIESFKAFTSSEKYCAIGSVKSNIGHLLTAAGIAGVIKVIMAMQNKILPPSINFSELNKHISLNHSPFYINTNKKKWESQNNQPRLAAISSFGFSGTNSHIVLEEWNSDLNGNNDDIESTNLFVLSAASKEQLVSYIEKMLFFLENQSYNFSDVLYTLQKARTPMKEKIFILIDNKNRLISRLQEIISTKSYSSFEILVENIDSESLYEWKTVAEKWILNQEVEWEKFYTNYLVKRIPLPTYPFAPIKYWIDQKEDKYNDSGILLPSLEIHKMDKDTDFGYEEPISLVKVSEDVIVDNIGDISQSINSQVSIPNTNNKASTLNKLTTSLAQCLYLKAEEIDINKDFMDMGLDSILGVEWIRKLKKSYNWNININALYDYPTLLQLAKYIETRLTSNLEIENIDFLLNEVSNKKINLEDAEKWLQENYLTE